MCSIPNSTIPARGNTMTIAASAEARSKGGAPRRANERLATTSVPIAKAMFSTSGVESCTWNRR